MLRRYSMVVAVAVVIALAGCSSNGPTDPNQPGMPMGAVAADSVSR